MSKILCVEVMAGVSQLDEENLTDDIKVSTVDGQTDLFRWNAEAAYFERATVEEEEIPGEEPEDEDADMPEPTYVYTITWSPV